LAAQQPGNIICCAAKAPRLEGRLSSHVRHHMTTTILADGSRVSFARMAVALLGPIVVWAGFGVWKGYSALAIVGVAVPLGALSLWAVSGRGAWKQVVIDSDAISLLNRDGSTVTIQRDSILHLELREQAIAIKWHAQPKDRVEVLGKERFSQSSWTALCSSLEPWAKSGAA
jgi:hypothetical protein